MTLQELIQTLQVHEEYGNQQVFIHNEETDDDIPLGKVRLGPRQHDGTHAIVLCTDSSGE